MFSIILTLGLHIGGNASVKYFANASKVFYTMTDGLIIWLYICVCVHFSIISLENDTIIALKIVFWVSGSIIVFVKKNNKFIIIKQFHRILL